MWYLNNPSQLNYPNSYLIPPKTSIFNFEWSFAWVFWEKKIDRTFGQYLKVWNYFHSPPPHTNGALLHFWISMKLIEPQSGAFTSEGRYIPGRANKQTNIDTLKLHPSLTIANWNKWTLNTEHYTETIIIDLFSELLTIIIIICGVRDFW